MNSTLQPKHAHSSGYVWIKCEDHPRAHKGYVLEHVLVAEKKLRRFLRPEEVVHHENEIKTDNRPENIRVFANNSEHRKHHQNLIALRECGNPHWRKCVFCKNYDTVENMSRKALQRWFHKECARINYHIQRAIRLN